MRDYNNLYYYTKSTLLCLLQEVVIDIKNLFAKINNKDVNVGGSQKANALSPLDFRLSYYLMAMFNFYYELISSLNSFNLMSKDRYLSYMDKPRHNKLKQ
jgi:hypothetical protein